MPSPGALREVRGLALAEAFSLLGPTWRSCEPIAGILGLRLGLGLAGLVGWMLRARMPR